MLFLSFSVSLPPVLASTLAAVGKITQSRLKFKQSKCVDKKQGTQRIPLTCKSILSYDKKTNLERNDAATTNIDFEWFWSFACSYSPQCRWISRCCRIQCLYYFWLKVNSINKWGWMVLQQSSISQAASISPAGRWSINFNGWDENEILSRPARFISRNRLIEEMIWPLNLQLNLLKKSLSSEWVNCGKLCISLWPCACILRLKLPKVKGTFPTHPKTWQSQKAQKNRPDRHFRCFRHCDQLRQTRNYESDTSNVICFESNCAKNKRKHQDWKHFLTIRHGQVALQHVWMTTGMCMQAEQSQRPLLCNFVPPSWKEPLRQGLFHIVGMPSGQKSKNGFCQMFSVGD